MSNTAKQQFSSETREKLVALYRSALSSGIPLDTINQQVQRQILRSETTRVVVAEDTKKRIAKARKKIPLTVRVGAFIIPIAFLSVGLYLVGSAAFPILAGFVASKSWMAGAKLVAPIPEEEILAVTPLVITQVPQVLAKEQEISKIFTGPEILDEELDYTNLTNWFSDIGLPELAVDTSVDEQKKLTYMIDIPKLNISNAMVTIGGTDLNNSLIAYPGTANPGDPGSPVIFGHSVLRQFYNPNEKNPRRYNSIFSTIMTLKPGDVIYVTHEGVRYTYMVQEKKEVKPEDVYILTQQYDSRQLKLVTCTPEGTYLRRGVITATLIPTEESEK